ncbi:hypothetical protein AB1Y20_007602 [Prymnesium parvum]|uniref:Uncharacterized protein n=1 Tax=Prymnesium parvum TaxID=97485 RepID=A0AB34IWJ0_PRYPA
MASDMSSLPSDPPSPRSTDGNYHAIPFFASRSPTEQLSSSFSSTPKRERFSLAQSRTTTSRTLHNHAQSCGSRKSLLQPGRRSMADSASCFAGSSSAPPPSPPTANSVLQSWVWSIRQLARKRPDTGTRLSVSMAQTVLFTGGEPVLWVFTSKTGEVLRKNHDKLRVSTVRDALCGRAIEDENSILLGSELDYIATVRRGPSKAASLKALVLVERDLVQLLSFEQRRSIVALQEYVKGSGHGGTRYRCQAALERAELRRLSFQVVKLCYATSNTGRRDAPHPRGGATSNTIGPATALKSQMTSFNAVLHKVTRDVLVHLEAVTRQRVTRLVADFVKDAHGQPVLISLPEVFLEPVEKKPAPPRPASASVIPRRRGSNDGTTIPTTPTAWWESPAPEKARTRPSSAAAFSNFERAFDHNGGIKTSGGRPQPWLRLHPPLSRGSDGKLNLASQQKSVECAGDFCQVDTNQIGDDSEGRRRTRVQHTQQRTPSQQRGLIQKGHAEFIVPYKSILLARVEKEIPNVDNVKERCRLLESGQPGSVHPADPQKPHPFEYYSGVWVCKHCYITYCRLDKVRQQTHPRQIQPDRSAPTRPYPLKSQKPDGRGCINGDPSLGPLPRHSFGTNRLAVSANDLDFRKGLNTRQRVKQVLREIVEQNQSAASGSRENGHGGYSVRNSRSMPSLQCGAANPPSS